jgi:hypothetical protein
MNTHSPAQAGAAVRRSVSDLGADLPNLPWTQGGSRYQLWSFRGSGIWLGLTPTAHLRCRQCFLQRMRHQLWRPGVPSGLLCSAGPCPVGDVKKVSTALTGAYGDIEAAPTTSSIVRGITTAPTGPARPDRITVALPPASPSLTFSGGDDHQRRAATRAGVVSNPDTCRSLPGPAVSSQTLTPVGHPLRAAHAT